MVKNEEMHYIDSDDQEEKSAGEKKPKDKWVILKHEFINVLLVDRCLGYVMNV